MNSVIEGLINNLEANLEIIRNSSARYRNLLKESELNQIEIMEALNELRRINDNK